MKHWVIIIAVLLIATPARAEVFKRNAPEFPPYGHSSVTEITQLMIMLKDNILRDVVCRLSSQAFEPATLARAIGVKERSDIVRRINTLRRWGLVRIGITETGTKVAEAIPGKGTETLRRWTEKYCIVPDSCEPDF